MLILTATAIFGVWGFLTGLFLVPLLLVTQKTIDGEYGYLYPLIPWNGSAMARLFFRLKKKE